MRKKNLMRHYFPSLPYQFLLAFFVCFRKGKNCVIKSTYFKCLLFLIKKDCADKHENVCFISRRNDFNIFETLLLSDENSTSDHLQQIGVCVLSVSRGIQPGCGDLPRRVWL